MAVSESFKDRHLDLRYLLTELAAIRRHNQSTPPGPGSFYFAEGALVLLALERFLRLVLGPDATDTDTIFNLLQKAFSKDRRLLVPPGDRAVVVAQINKVRRTLAHANYEQAAREAGCADVRQYFQDEYLGEIEMLYKILDDFVKQIDPETGKPIR